MSLLLLKCEGRWSSCTKRLDKKRAPIHLSGEGGRGVFVGLLDGELTVLGRDGADCMGNKSIQSHTNNHTRRPLLFLPAMH